MPTTLRAAVTRPPLAWPAVPRRVGLALLAVLAAGVALSPHAWAARPCHVPGDFATIQAAVNDATCATINVAAGTYEEGHLEISRDVTIRGEGQDRTVIGGLVVTIHAGTVTITGVTIQNGFGLANFGTLTLANSTVTGITTSGNPAVFNGGTLVLRNCTVAGNTNFENDTIGGGLANSGTLTLANSTVTDNVAFLGGGLANVSRFGTVTITNSTIAGNTTDTARQGAAFGGIGGGLFTLGGTVTITNSTIAGNTAGVGGGGGGLASFSGTVTITNSTIAGNTAGVGGGVLNAGTLTLRRVTFRNNDPNDCVDIDIGTGCPAP